MTADQDEDFYRSLFEHSMDAVLYTVPDGQILAANPAACNLFNYTEAEICALGRSGLVDIVKSPQLSRMLEERERTGRTQGEATYIRSDGTRFAGWMNSVVFLDAAGQPKTVMIIRDLTEAKIKEATLRQSIRELDDLYNHAPCGYHSVNADGIIININETELSWLGRSREEMIGKTFRSHLNPEYLQVYLKSFERFKKVGSQKDLELELIHKDGSKLPVLLNSTAIYDEKSEFIMSRTVLTDLTVHKQLERVIEDKVLELQSIMDGANIAISLIKNRHLVWANRRMCDMFGYTQTEIANQDTRMFYSSQENYTELGTKAYPQLQRGLTYRAEMKMRRRDGQFIWVELSGSAIAPSDLSLGTIWVMQNITARKLAEIELARSTREIEDLYENAPCGYHSVDANGTIIKINQTELNWLGYKRSELLGKHIRDIHSPSSQPLLEEKFKLLSQHEPVHDMEMELIRKDGTILPVLLNATAVYDDAGNFVMSRSTILDLTDRKELEQELKRQARVDHLTGLNNRGNFKKLAEREFAASKRLSRPLGFLIFDIDHFKQVNDIYGHDTGDIVLMEVGECCLRTLREIDIVGRWGGEEFVAILPEVTEGQVQNAAERLRAALSKIKVDIDQDRSVSFTVSIGASCLQSSDSSLKGLMKRADMALYSAKAAGRNRVILDS